MGWGWNGMICFCGVCQLKAHITGEIVQVKSFGTSCFLSLDVVITGTAFLYQYFLIHSFSPSLHPFFSFYLSSFRNIFLTVFCRTSFLSLALLVRAGSPSRGRDVVVYVRDIHQPSLPTPFYSVLVSVSVLMTLSIVFHSINFPDNSPLSHSVLPVLFLSYSSFQLYIYIFMKVSLSPDIILCG